MTTFVLAFSDTRNPEIVGPFTNGAAANQYIRELELLSERVLSHYTLSGSLLPTDPDVFKDKYVKDVIRSLNEQLDALAQ